MNHHTKMHRSNEDDDQSSHEVSSNERDSGGNTTGSATEGPSQSVVKSENATQLQPLEPKASDPLALEEERLKAYARLLDSAIRLPGGFRIGLDGIVGLIPGIGDILGAALSGYLIYGASRLDIPGSVIVRMIINTLIETVVGAIPVFGDVFDFVFKANDRNARLLHAALEKRNHERGTGSLDA